MTRLTADNPIDREEQDTLRRVEAARLFAHQVLSLDPSEGLVVAVLGPWGSGKTSFLNLSRPEWKNAGAVLLDFNPWMFSGAETLVDSFFVELSAQLKIRPDMAGVASAMEAYGEAFSGLAWLPVVGVWLERMKGLARIASEVMKRRKEGVTERRRKLQAALRELKHPIIVVLDDIDRLGTDEIRSIFKLVRLTASFPNIVYVLAFDRGRVETALGEQGLNGRDYLEKIIQVGVDLPAIPPATLRREIFASLDHALEGVDDVGVLDQATWPDIFAEVVEPPIRNMRDVRRYVAATRGTVVALRGQIALADVLGLEAVRTFLPDVYLRLHGSVAALTAGAQPGEHGQAKLKADIDALITAGGTHAIVVKSMIERLFPGGARHVGGMHYGADWAARWLRDRRVAHEDFLRLYLERVAGEGLQSADRAAQAFKILDDGRALNAFLRSLNRSEVEDVISGLETYEDEYRAEHVVPGCVTVLNLWPDLPERPTSMFGFGTRTVLSRVTYRLLRSLADPDLILQAVREILPQLSTLSAKLEVIDDVGYRENVGHKLVTPEAASELERAWRAEVRATSVAQLLGEPELLRVLWVVQRDAVEGEERRALPDDPELTLALLRAAKGEVVSQGMDSRALRRSPRLHWKTLVALFGDEEVLRARLAKAKRPPEDSQLFELADRYLSGWRPDEM